MRLAIHFGVFLLWSSSLSWGSAISAEVAREGKALMPVVVASNASKETWKLAEELAAGLGQMSGAKFEVLTGGSTGILVGTDEEWPGFLKPVPSNQSALLAREDYLLRSEEGRVLVVGRTALGTQDAVWDLLYRLGFRQFFPGKNWEIWPQLPSIAVEVNTFQTPNYYTRKIFLPGIAYRSGQKAFKEWQARNRMVSGFNLESGHAYNAIINRNPDHFAKYPKDIARNEPGVPLKLDPSRQTVLDIAAEDAIRQLEENPALDTIRMDPSDGGGWRTDSPLGSPSNQAITLANHVSREIQAKFPGRKVGIYAYNEHSPAPELEVDPNVIVCIATSFVRGGFTVDQLTQAWRAKGAEIGIREYLSVWSWEKDLPGRSRASNIGYIFSTIPHFYQLGARYWITEGSTNWASHGLGYYLASRLLWDTGEASQREALLEDFFQRSFGAAAPEMKAFYRYLLLESKPLLSDDLLGRMYRTLQDAHRKAETPDVSRRIDDFVIYTRFVDLMFAYINAKGEAKQPAYEELAEFAVRAHSSYMVNSIGIVRTMAKREREISPLVRWQDLDKEASARPALTGVELAQIMEKGVASKTLNDFQPVAFSSNLIPLNQDKAAGGEQGAAPVGIRGTNPIYGWLEPQRKAFRFQVRGGLIYQNKGAVRLRLFSDQHALVDEPVASAEVPSDREMHEVELASPYDGLHRIEISDGGAQTEISWSPEQRVAFPVSPDQKAMLWGKYEMVFYVPKGTKIVGGFSESPTGSVELMDGKQVFDFGSMKQAGYFSIPVPEESAGTWWRFKNANGAKLLLTVPPYLFRSSSELMVPSELK